MTQKFLAGPAAFAVLMTAAAAHAQTPYMPATGHADLTQGNMQDALRSLAAAQVSLNKASRGKGGHRLKALQLVSQAIVEVKAGIYTADER